nr:uncharacterized protein LOC112292446 isoform X2 [Physcomitrium patens]|eukprot:XP_024396716.1 uncharacterized protein LOC112292446 isoform X2 [Physcomitrella patens]
MLKLVASLSRPGGGGRHLRLCHYSTNVPTPAATTFWHQRIPLQNLAETSKSRVLMTNDFTRVHLPWKPSSSRSVCPRGFTSDASATQSGFIAWYLRMLDKYTFPTKSITAANILAFADITAQYLANETLKEGETKQDWDKIRTLRMLGIGAFFTAPILHIWFNLMLWRFPKTDVASSMKKVLAGQLIASPVVNSSFFAGRVESKLSRRSSVIFGRLGKAVPCIGQSLTSSRSDTSQFIFRSPHAFISLLQFSLQRWSSKRM